PASVLASPSADGARKPTMAGFMRATCLGEDACSPSTCRGSHFPPSWSFSLNVPTSTSIGVPAIARDGRSWHLYVSGSHSASVPLEATSQRAATSDEQIDERTGRQ